MCFASINSDVVNLPVREGVTEKYIMTWEDSATPTSAVILFAGGAGGIGISKKGNVIHLDLPNNFLVRSREFFVDENIMSVVIDSPSDKPQGMDDTFRESSAHTNDLSKIVDDVKSRFPGIKVYFIGTSRGTISTAYTGKALQSKLEGIVFTSTVALNGGIGSFNFNSIKIPMLIVHHHNDGCKASPYENAQDISEKYKIPLVTVYGGDEPISKPCEALSAHGYLGKEQETVNEIKNWINHKPIQLKI
jgi:predicted esterase